MNDYDTVVRDFEQARPFLANCSLSPASLAYVARKRAQLEQSEIYLKKPSGSIRASLIYSFNTPLSCFTDSVGYSKRSISASCSK